MNEEPNTRISFVKKAEYAALLACLVLTGALYIGNVPAHAQATGFQTQPQETTGTSSAGAPTFNGVPQECGTGKIYLTWSGVAGATSYQLYRDVTSVKIYESEATSYTDSGLQNGSQHTYYLVTLGGEDTTPRSLTISAPPACNLGLNNTSTTTAATAVPPVPSNLTAVLETSQGGIVLNWGSATGEYGITILRRVGSGNFSTLQNVQNSSHSLVDSNITFGTTYQYALRACNSGGCSPQSNSATVQTPANTSTTGTNTTTSTGVPTPTGTSTPTGTATTTQQPPTQPGTFAILAKPATECNANYIVLTWNRPSDANTYEVYRNDTFVFTTANLYFNDSTLNPDTTYSYKVIALRAGVRFAYGITSAHTAKQCAGSFTAPTEPIGIPPSTTVPPTGTVIPNKPSEPIPAPKPPVSTIGTPQPVAPKPVTPSYTTQPYQPPVQAGEETGARPVVAAPPSALVLSMQEVAETVSTAQSTLNETRDRLITHINEHADSALEGASPEHRIQIEPAVNAIRTKLIGYVRGTLGDISGATPDVLSRLKSQLDAGYQEINTVAQRSAQSQSPERTSIGTSIDSLAETIVGASAALQSSGGDQLYKDTNKDGISDYDSVRIYHIDPVAPSPVTVVGTTTLTAGQKVLLGYDPREKELVKVTPEEPRASLAPETPIYAVKEVALTPEKKVTIRGTALPNSYVTVYVYSTPIIVTVKTDGAGQWEYTVDKELESGSHTIYAATVDNSGMIVARSVAIPFTQTAEAATLDTAPLGLTATEKPSLFNNPAVIPLFVLSLLFVIGVLYVMGRNQSARNEPPALP